MSRCVNCKPSLRSMIVDLVVTVLFVGMLCFVAWTGCQAITPNAETPPSFDFDSVKPRMGNDE